MFTPNHTYFMTRLVLVTLLCAGLLAGCNKPGKLPGSDNTKQVGQAPELKAVPGQPETKMPPKMPPKMGRRPLFAGAHILVAYQGAAKATVTRSKEDALKLAKELTATARKAPGSFTAMARKHSEGPSARTGGFLRIWPKGKMLPAFDKAIEKLKFDEISDPVETAYGYHVIKRLPIFAGAHILVAYKGAERVRPDVTRTKDDARKQAKDLMMKARKTPANFPKLAKDGSDCPSKAKGGDLGLWWKGAMAPAFDKAVDKLKEGEVSEVVETPFGFHVIMRKQAPTLVP